ncbi:MAG TPA: bifunctional UDP-sugar hydrolase/5'-nucleotidase [Pyrinomonadaceae bacterium]
MTNPRVRAAGAVWRALVLALVCAGAAYAQARPPAERTVRVTLLQVNDVYQIAPVDKGKRGGLARVATLRRRIIAEQPNTLFLLSGDTISPSVASNIFKGRQMIETWNAVGLDYAVLGNHEFDFGNDVLLQRMKESRFVWLGTNVQEGARPFAGLPPVVVRDVGGVRVGLFGLVTVDTKQTSSPGAAVRFLDPCQTARRAVAQLRRRGAQVVVALTHLTMGEDKRVARCAPIDVIIGGHEHELLQSLSGRTPIFKMGSDARNLGRIDLNVAPRTGRLVSIDWQIIPVDESVPAEAETAKVVDEFEQRLSAELDKPVGRTAVELDARQATNRAQETNLGSFIADAYRQQTGADVAIVNGGSIRSNTTYPAGPLSKRDILSILPFENAIVKVEVTGAQVRAALEHGVARIGVERENGAFPQVSGVRFAYDARRQPGQRVTSATVNGQPLDDRKTYTLATSVYVLNGGDGYTMFKGARFLITPEQAQVEPAVVMNTISAAAEIAPKPDGRIVRQDR